MRYANKIHIVKYMWNDPEIPAAHYFMKREPEKKKKKNKFSKNPTSRNTLTATAK